MIKNPILPGFNPDASVVKVGADYYLATSTFEWWPGVEIYHSRNLVNWELVAEPINSQSKANLVGNYDSGSIWAPHLSYSEGRFWLIYTDVKTGTAFKDTLNYVISCETIDGEWSEPVFVTASGFDPALFHDDDGRHYVINMLFDHRLEKPNFAGLVIQELCLKTLKLIGERTHFFTGTDLGVCEGPQILKKEGWYYLLCAAGGTGYSHAATVCRSKTLLGPYEVSPYHPLLTTKTAPTNPLQKSGHASFVPVTDDEWYLVHICARPLTQRGNCPLGRETALQKIDWINGWPRLANGTCYPDLEVEAPSIAQEVQQQTDFSQYYAFEETTLPKSLKTLRRSLGEKMSLIEHPGYLRLYGEQSLSSLHQQSLVARRWQKQQFRAETKLYFQPKNYQQMAGLVLYYDTSNWQYLSMSFDEERQQAYLQVEVAEVGKFFYLSERIYLTEEHRGIQLAVEVNREQGQFFYKEAAMADFRKIGSQTAADHLSDDFIKANGKLAFTGAMVGICAQDMDQHDSYGDFAYLSYQEK